MRNSILAIVVLLSLGATAADRQTSINQVPIQRTSWASGKQMFDEYCAACHGLKANGTGPAASACKVRPRDLTTLAKANQGKFPYDYFYAVLQFGTLLPTPAHGSADMPVWMPLFYSLDEEHKAIAEQRMHNIASYVASLQAK
jgi:mono/diheme cytochrome c family protein